VGTRAEDPPSPSMRWDLHRSPGARVAGHRALALADLGVDDVDHLDLYACFPASVQVCSTELGIDLDGDRPLTVTGGLTFAGGPHSNSVGQSLAAMVERLRELPGMGFIYANGGYFGKHAFGVYGSEPPIAGYRSEDLHSEVEELPVRVPDPAFTGKGTIDGYTVVYDQNGRPERALVALLTDEGARVWGGTTDRASLVAMVDEEHVGQTAEIDPDGLVAF